MVVGDRERGFVNFGTNRSDLVVPLLHGRYLLCCAFRDSPRSG